MNNSKSSFGVLCEMYRVPLRLSEKNMGKEIEKLKYKLGREEGKNKQPLVSQFEYRTGNDEISKKNHRDPPLDYIEACSELFSLTKTQKYELFVAALMSSDKITIDKKAIEGDLKEDIVKIITTLILSYSELNQCIERNNKLRNEDNALLYANFNQKKEKLFQAWDEIKQASKKIIDEIVNITYNSLK